MAAVAGILEYSSGHMPDAAGLRRFTDRIVQADPDLFRGALLFTSKNDGAFALLHETGDGLRARESWSHWPLDRLFAKRRASLITNPGSGERGMAIPFGVSRSERSVVIVTLRDGQLSAADRDFLTTLEWAAASVPQIAPALRRSAVQNRIDTYSSSPPPTPRLLFFGETLLEERVKRLARRRGWEVRATVSCPDLIASVRESSDILLIEGTQAEVVEVLRAIRRAAPQVPVLCFDGGRNEEIDVLADRRLSHDAGDTETFDEIEAMVADLPRRRREYLESAVNRALPGLTSVQSPRELSRAIADTARRLFGDWVAVHLLDTQGDMYGTELPAGAHPLMREIPNTFISGYAVMKSHIDEAFFEALTDDEQTREDLAQLNPISGAALPLMHEGSVSGTLIVLTTERELGEPEFEALLQFAEAASLAFAVLQVRIAKLTLSTSHEWTRISVGDYDIHVYHPHAHRGVTFHALPLDAHRIGIEVRDVEGGALMGTLNLDQGTFSYEAIQFPPPVQISASGPASAMGEAGNRPIAHTLMLKPPSVTLIYDAEFPRLVDSGRVVEVLQNAMRAAAENPAFELAQFVQSERAGFIAITSRSG